MKQKMILYGSKAAHHWFPEFRAGLDIDIIARPGTTRPKLNGPVEIHYLPAFEWLLENKEHNRNGIASPEALYTIKTSHAYWRKSWQKTMNDISFFQERGVKHIPEFHDILYEAWQTLPGRSKAHMNFDVPNENFFKKTVTRHIAHDQLHELVKYDSEPKYKSIKPDMTKAAISDEMFENLSDRDKMLVALEETFVIALERRIVPKKFYTNESAIRYAYDFSLYKNIVDLNKGAVPKYMVLNWNRLRNCPDEFFEKCRLVGEWAEANNIQYEE